LECWAYSIGLREETRRDTGPWIEDDNQRLEQWGRDVYMADFEDSTPPLDGDRPGTVEPERRGHRTIEYRGPDGRSYRFELEDRTLVWSRGLHLKGIILIASRVISASFFDYGLYLFHM